MKDPAFLFYSNDFYSGTRTMLPEERACYIDLLIYQHQNGFIPDEPKRLLMFCSGVDEATLKATLGAKFERTDKGWVNKRLQNEIERRENFKNSQSESGKIGQFWKKVYKIFNKNEVKQLKENLSKDSIINILEDLDLTDEATLKATLESMFKHRLNNKETKTETETKDKNKLNYYFDSEKFKSKWEEWKQFRKSELKKPYKSDMGEQKALTGLKNISSNESEAIKIIEKSMMNGWQGFFSLDKKSNQNGATKRITADSGSFNFDKP